MAGTAALSRRVCGANVRVPHRAQSRRRHIDHWQRRRVDSLDEDAPFPAAQPDPERALSTQQRHEQLRAAVRSLPLGLRQVVVLSLEGLSHAEIAAVAGITENNVAVRLTRARAALSRLLGARKDQI